MNINIIITTIIIIYIYIYISCGNVRYVFFYLYPSATRAVSFIHIQYLLASSPSFFTTLFTFHLLLPYSTNLGTRLFKENTTALLRVPEHIRSVIMTLLKETPTV